MVALQDIRAAAARIEAFVRQTPMLRAGIEKVRLSEAPLLSLKLEALQITGSFKVRGALNKVMQLDHAVAKRGLVSASGGNHGLGVAYAGWRQNIPVTILLPHSTAAGKAEKLRQWGAEVRLHGQVWDEANEAALAFAEQSGRTYVHPFADASVIAGQGTLGLEVLAQDASIDTFLVAIGGGGLIAGIASAVKTMKPAAKIIGVEPTGAPTLHNSMRAGKVIRLDKITTAANSLAPQSSDPLNVNIIRDTVDDIVLVDDAAMRDAAQKLWFDYALASELAGAASLAALQTGAYRPQADEHVCALICGAGEAKDFD